MVLEWRPPLEASGRSPFCSVLFSAARGSPPRHLARRLIVAALAALQRLGAQGCSTCYDRYHKFLDGHPRIDNFFTTCSFV